MSNTKMSVNELTMVFQYMIIGIALGRDRRLGGIQRNDNADWLSTAMKNVKTSLKKSKLLFTCSFPITCLDVISFSNSTGLSIYFKLSVTSDLQSEVSTTATWPVNWTLFSPDVEHLSFLIK